MSLTVFVRRGETVRKHFTLYDPDTGDAEDCWIDLRAELSGSERENISLYSAVNRADGEGMRVDLADLKRRRVGAWLVRWNFGSGLTRPVDEDAIACLTGPVLDLIDDLILAHAEAAAAKSALVLDPTLARPKTSTGDSPTPEPSDSDPTSIEPSASDN